MLLQLFMVFKIITINCSFFDGAIHALYLRPLRQREEDSKGAELRAEYVSVLEEKEKSL